ncbi:hypothetical protein [Tardiphaga sp.]|uniref:hypothetical protein n=1 Tax=Tardiphaga sp. TaxID=1926292 RepID=UPI0026031774|nr:hypothetical protein [Tardiphaga sp.]MDB5616419.1 hypothetical protein [Tardiphaga sp.]
MQERIYDDEPSIDRVTSASICTAIGQRLRRNLTLEATELPSHLQALLDEMQRQDSDNAASV